MKLNKQVATDDSWISTGNDVGVCCDVLYMILAVSSDRGLRVRESNVPKVRERKKLNGLQGMKVRYDGSNNVIHLEKWKYD